MSAAATDYFCEVGNPGTATTLAAPGHTIAGTTFNVVSTSNWPTTTGVIFAVDNYTLQTVNGVSTAVRTAGTYTEWEGTVTSSTVISNAVLRYGTDQNYSAGSLTRVYIPVASSRENRLAQGISLHANQDGSLKTSAVQAALGLTNLNGYTPVGYNPNTVTYNGNRSYTCVFNTVDLTSFLSPGMRIQTTRTVAAPNQCASLNGTTQYFVKTSPNKLSFTDDFVVSAWVKMTSYGTENSIASRFNGTSGWDFRLNSSGQVILIGYNAGGGNASYVQSYQSIPLNRWVHITAQLDMSTFTATATTSYVMIEGVDVPVQVLRSGTNPTALIQAGNLEIGSRNGGTQFFPGKIAQVGIFSAKVTQATMQTYISQGLLGSETSLDTAFSLSNSTSDLNATTPNNLSVGGGSAVTTNADSPFGGQAGGAISTTLDYAEVVSVAFSTNTTVVMRVPDVNTIPTIGGISGTVYSSNIFPYGWPGISNILAMAQICSNQPGSATTSDTDVAGLIVTATIPAGRRARVVFCGPDYDLTGAIGATYGILKIKEGSTQLASSSVIPSVANYPVGYTVTYITNPTTGSHTYKATSAAGVASGAGATIGASITSPAFLFVELI